MLQILLLFVSKFIFYCFSAMAANIFGWCRKIPFYSKASEIKWIGGMLIHRLLIENYSLGILWATFFHFLCCCFCCYEEYPGNFQRISNFRQTSTWVGFLSNDALWEFSHNVICIMYIICILLSISMYHLIKDSVLIWVFFPQSALIEHCKKMCHKPFVTF